MPPKSRSQLLTHYDLPFILSGIRCRFAPSLLEKGGAAPDAAGRGPRDPRKTGGRLWNYKQGSNSFPIETARCRNIRGKLNFLMKIAALACLIVCASLAIAEGQSIFIQSPPVTSISTKTRGSPSSSVDLNQAAMSQIINQLNQRQFQLSVTAAQARTSAQRSVFVPQKITIKRAK